MDAYTPPNNLDPVAFLAGSFGGNVAPYSNVTPFTHRDARTFEGRVEALVYWVNHDFVLWNNTEINRLVDEVNKQYQQFRQVFVDFTAATQADQAAFLANTKAAQLAFEGVVNAAEALITEASTHVDEGVVAAQLSAEAAERWNAATEVLQDLAVSTLVGDEGSVTIRALDAYVSPLGVNVRRYGVKADGATDDTAKLNSVLAASAGQRVIFPVGVYNVSDMLVVPDDTILDMTGARIKMTAPNKTLMRLGKNSRTISGTLEGYGADYVKNGSPVANGISMLRADGAEVHHTRLVNFSGAAISVIATKAAGLYSPIIVGVGTPTIAANDKGSCYGILLDSDAFGITSTDTKIRDADISHTCQGIISGISVPKVSISGCSIHDIDGQHGMYLQNGTDVMVTSNQLWNINYNGIKVQLAGNSTADSPNTTVSMNTVRNAGDNGIILYNVDAALVFKFVSAVVMGNTLDGCARGIYLGSLRAFTYMGNTVRGSVQHGLQMQDCQDGEVHIGSIIDPGRIGVLLGAVANGSNARLVLRGGVIRNPGNLAVANATYGISYNEGTDITFDGVVITASNAKMDRGVLVASTADQLTSTWRNMVVEGATAVAAQFRTQTVDGATGPMGVKEFSGNKFPLMLNPPTGIITTAAPAAGTAGALPATPMGYHTVLINGVPRKVAYYNI